VLVEGYCPCNTTFDDLPELSPDAKIVIKDEIHVHKKVPVARSLDSVLCAKGLDLVEPIPAPNCPIGFKFGAQRRVARKLPKTNKMKLKLFRDFVKCFIRRHFEPLGPDTDFGFEPWLERTQYTDARKVELREVYKSMVRDGSDIKLSKRNKFVKAFIKREHYNKYKPPRWIMARVDAAKVVLGPIFKQIEDVVFKHPAFIKHVPVSERPNYIASRLNEEGTVVITDYTSFESQFKPAIMEIVEFQLYKFMLKAYPNKFAIIKQILSGENHIGNNLISLKLKGRRMSGEMNTSLGNGFSNWVLMEFLCYMKGSKMKGVFEGDDGLCIINGPVPTVEDARECGFVLKVEKVRSLSEGSFCGLIFDDVEKINVRDPVHVLLRFGWTLSSRLRGKPDLMRSLLKAKSYSLLYETPACPIISALAMRLLDLMPEVNPSWQDDWWARVLRERDSYDIPLRSHKPGPRTRILVQERFGISVATQIEVEKFFATLSLGQKLCDPSIDKMLQEYRGGVDLNHVFDFSSKFVYRVEAGEPIKYIG